MKRDILVPNKLKNAEHFNSKIRPTGPTMIDMISVFVCFMSDYTADGRSKERALRYKVMRKYLLEYFICWATFCNVSVH